MAPGERLFTFAVIADTHVNQEEGKASSDFAVNRLSNARNRYAFEAVRGANPAFVLHLGDIVHPTPGHPAYAQAAESFGALAARLECPLHLTPGNHDVGDKPGDWLPVPSVNEEYLALYERHFGRRFYSFDAHHCHFVVIDAQVINSGLPAESDQRRWLERDLAEHDGVRTFLCTHYPPFVLDPAEEGNYDNIDEPGRTWLLALIARHGVEAVFAGHVHNFACHRLGVTDLYYLPSTAFVRLDYSEMYRIEPGPERGRDDTAKLGFFIVDVHAHGHVVHPVRTHGACLAADEAAPPPEDLPLVHPRTIARSPLGVDLRQAWAEVTEIGPSGAIDEFGRKAVRNDYPVMALWEMGIRRLRVPIADLRGARMRERVRLLQGSGHEFTVHSHGAPSVSVRALLAEHAGLVAGWEIIAPLSALAQIAPRVAEARRGLGFPVRFSKLRRPGDALHHGEKARHVIQHGFDLADADAIEALFEDARVRAAFDGVVFRIPRARAPAEEIRAIEKLGWRIGTRDEAMVRFADDNPAIAQDDELAAANRMAEALFAAHASATVGVWTDTFADVDRGYFPRSGLVDRRYNPRLAGKVCRNLNRVLASGFSAPRALAAHLLRTGRLFAFEGARQSAWLVLPDRPMKLRSLPEAAGHAMQEARWFDLATGASGPLRWSESKRTKELRFEAPLACAAPLLLRLSSSGDSPS